MPKYFHSKAEQLHAEAFASLLLIEERFWGEDNSRFDARVCKIIDNARNRVYRRWNLAFGGK